MPALLLHGLSPPAAAPGRRSWAALLERVFAFDVVHCPHCGGRRRIVAVHTRPRLARCHLDLGKLARRTGQRQQAQEHLTTATTLLREMGMRLRVEQAEAELRY